MILIGVTGGVGTGKTTVARMFGDCGAVVLDADKITHELMRPKKSVWRAIRSAFGKEIFGVNGEIIRQRLAGIVFSDPKKMKRLTRIIHPAVRREIQKKIKKLSRRNQNAVVVLDIPLLLEAGSAYQVDAVVVVSSSFRAAAQRLRTRSGWTPAELRRRQALQFPLKTKERMADFVVRNNKSEADARRQVVNVWRRIIKGE